MSDPDNEPNYLDDDGEALEARSPILAVIDGGLTPTALDVALCALPTNDLGNAKRLEQRNEGQIWWTKEWGPGVWDGKRFDFEHGDAKAGIAAQQTADRLLSHEVPAFYKTQKGRREMRADFEKRASKFYGFALSAGNNPRTEAMLKQYARRRTVPLAQFDPLPDRLAVANGVIDLPRDGSQWTFASGHDPAHMNTRVAAAKYDPGASATQFNKFLDKVMPDPEVRAFLARIVGYCLTGDVQEQAYFIFQGKGGDGKSTFLEAIAAMLGGYVANADINTFLKHPKKGSDHSDDVARLASGPRLVKAAEPEQGAQFAEAMLKSVTGGERIVARAMYKGTFEFQPTWKLIVSCNRKPQIRGDDRGIWRRTLVVPWPVSLEREEWDKILKPKLAAERDGILNWALSGWKDWKVRGLNPPAAVLAAIEQYRLSSSPFGVWFDTCCATKDMERGRETSARLYKSYCGFAQEAGSEPMSAQAFGRSMGDRSLVSIRSNGMHWGGVTLNAEGERFLSTHEQSQKYPTYGTHRS